MKKNPASPSAILAFLLLAGLAKPSIADPAARHDMGSMATTGAPVLGSVSFETSCKPQVKEMFNRGVALLHSFWLDEAQRTFEKVAKRDPDCAMAQWGVAVSTLNQVNGGPSAAGVALGTQALANAATLREKDPRESAYLVALHSYLDGYSDRDVDTYTQRYAGAMGKLAHAYPNDMEAQVFYALALINSEPNEVVSLANKRKAVAILSPLFRAHPRHPGIAHYIIHASDNPGMAQGAIEAAVRYASIAPAAPHALHMPSHIFKRLGLWQEDIRSNLASKNAAEASRVPVGAESRLHAMDFLEYAYLQTGEYSEAAFMVSEAKTVKASDVDPRYPTYYDIVEARFPVLLAIETRDWGTAASLPLQGPNWFSRAQALLAHAIAAAHRHDSAAGKAAAEALEASVASYPQVKAGAPKASLPDEIRAWARFAQDDIDGAIELLRPVADRQDKLGEERVEVPAREMLAEMFFLAQRFEDALTEYQGVLVSDPNRFNALLGAGRAAEALGERAAAANYYRTLVANCPKANGNALEELHHAREIAHDLE